MPVWLSIQLQEGYRVLVNEFTKGDHMNTILLLLACLLTSYALPASADTFSCPGGIVSSAVDGMKAAEAICRELGSR